MWGLRPSLRPRAPRQKRARRARNSARWQKPRAAAKQRDGNRCMNCGATEGLQVHHVVRLEDGGAELDLNNLVTLCVGCHGEQHRGDPGTTGRQALTPRARFSRKHSTWMRADRLTDGGRIRCGVAFSSGKWPLTCALALRHDGGEHGSVLPTAATQRRSIRPKTGRSAHASVKSRLSYFFQSANSLRLRASWPRTTVPPTRSYFSNSRGTSPYFPALSCLSNTLSSRVPNPML
jgi:hypothetical protein